MTTINVSVTKLSYVTTCLSTSGWVEAGRLYGDTLRLDVMLELFLPTGLELCWHIFTWLSWCLGDMEHYDLIVYICHIFSSVRCSNLLKATFVTIVCVVYLMSIDSIGCLPATVLTLKRTLVMLLNMFFQFLFLFKLHIALITCKHLHVVLLFMLVEVIQHWLSSRVRLSTFRTWTFIYLN